MTMTKRELIEALEATDCHDDTDIVIRTGIFTERLSITQVKLTKVSSLFEDDYLAIRLG